MFRFLFFFAIVCTAPAQTPGPFAAVIAEVEKIQSEPGMRTASIGFCVVALKPGESDSSGVSEAAEGSMPVFAGYHMDTGLVPASTMKVVTTATAVEVLGPEFRFKTELQHTGAIDAEAGILTGNVIVKGGGDPTLGASQIANTFARWQAALAEAGITKIEGSIVGDATVFGTQLVPDSWQWNDIGNYYGAGACGLTFHQNQFFCTFRTTTPGAGAALVGTDPRLPGIQFVNEMRVGPVGSGDQGYIYGHPYGKQFYLRGTVPAGKSRFTIKGSLPDPAFFCARAFTKHLGEHGVPVSGEPTTLRLLEIDGRDAGGERFSLLEQESETLEAILMVTNQKSNNLRAECIHRMIGLRRDGKGTTAAGAKVTEEYWKSKGIDMTGFNMADGCGLSRANTVTARQLAAILLDAAGGEHFETFYDSLPVAGRSGTLRSIGRGSSAEGRVHAKSGTLDRIRNYAGYVDATSGDRYAFALLINNYACDLQEVKARVLRVWTRLLDL